MGDVLDFPQDNTQHQFVIVVDGWLFGDRSTADHIEAFCAHVLSLPNVIKVAVQYALTLGDVPMVVIPPADANKAAK